jgi:outer membrane cobalamin receptor
MTLPVSRPAPLVVKPLAVAIAIAAVFPFYAFAQANQEKMLTPVVVTATRSPHHAT